MNREACVTIKGVFVEDSEMQGQSWRGHASHTALHGVRVAQPRDRHTRSTPTPGLGHSPQLGSPMPRFAAFFYKCPGPS